MFVSPEQMWVSACGCDRVVARRGRAARVTCSAMLLPLVLLFIAVPIAELAVIIQVGEAIGIWWTIALLIADSVLGSALMRMQGRAAWRRFNEAVQAGRVPAREVLDGALVIFGGALLLTPGFITDVLGLVLLFPPTRALVRGILVRRLAHRMVGAATRAQTRPGAGYDVEGTAVDVDQDRIERRREAP
jgi:UPF0716 protein FxsA